MNNKLLDFFQKNAVFRHEEFVEFCKQAGVIKQKNIRASLAYHNKKGHIKNIKKGIYISEQSYHQASPLVVAAKLYKDAVLAYHSALDFFGKSYSVYYTFFVLTANPTKPFEWDNYVFKPVRFPPRLKNKLLLVEEKVFNNQKVRVTSLERTVVDCLDKIYTSGGWEEVTKSFEQIDHLDIEALIAYAKALGTSSTIAKLGYFLECNQEKFHVSNEDLLALESLRPRSPRDLSYNEKGKFLKRWNISLPKNLVENNWDDPFLNSEDIPI